MEGAQFVVLVLCAYSVLGSTLIEARKTSGKEDIQRVPGPKDAKVNTFCTWNQFDHYLASKCCPGIVTEGIVTDETIKSQRKCNVSESELSSRRSNVTNLECLSAKMVMCVYEKAIYDCVHNRSVIQTVISHAIEKAKSDCFSESYETQPTYSIYTDGPTSKCMEDASDWLDCVYRKVYYDCLRPQDHSISTKAESAALRAKCEALKNEMAAHT